MMARRVMAASRRLWTARETTTALWLDAADSSTITLVSGGVSQWADKSGYMRHATQSTTSARPLLTNHGIVFDGINDFLICPAFTINSATSLFIVAKTDTLSGERTLINQQYEDGSRPWQHFFSYSGRLVDWQAGAYAPEIVAGNTFIFSEIQSAINEINCWLNGHIGVTGSNSTGYASSNAITIGKAQNYGRIGWLQGSVSEVVLMLSAAAPELRQKIEGYLAHKWGLSANLPSEHPYKSRPPRV